MEEATNFNSMKKVLLIISGILFLHQCGYAQTKNGQKELGSAA
jgi:hypothetical protein